MKLKLNKEKSNYAIVKFKDNGNFDYIYETDLTWIKAKKICRWCNDNTNYGRYIVKKIN